MTLSCAKCGSDDVHRVPQQAVEVSIAISWTSTASLDYLVCCTCGAIELSIMDKAYLPKIAEKYPKA